MRVDDVFWAIILLELLFGPQVVVGQTIGWGQYVVVEGR